jgi:hypothetical protein
MLGVDKLDQFASYYSFLHKSVKWWRKIFFWMLEVAVINSYIIYKKLATSRGRRPMTHKAYRRVLIDHLSAPLRSQGHQRRRRRPPPAQNLERRQGVPHYCEFPSSCRIACWQMELRMRNLAVYNTRCGTMSAGLGPSSDESQTGPGSNVNRRVFITVLPRAQPVPQAPHNTPVQAAAVSSILYFLKALIIYLIYYQHGC